MGERSNAELLRIIADTLGVEVEMLTASVSDRPARVGVGEVAAPEQLSRLVRAFRAIPDAASRLRALQYVEALAATPIRAD